MLSLNSLSTSLVHPTRIFRRNTTPVRGELQTQEAVSPVKKVSKEQSDIKENSKRSFLKSFLSLPSPLTVLKTALVSSVLAFAALRSPSIRIGLNEIAKYFNQAASPTNQDKVTSRQEIPKELRTFLWGNKRLNRENIFQRKGNCQIIATIIASSFTEESLKKLESLIEVTDYSLDENNFYINFAVNINGKRIPVSFEDLIQNNGSRTFYKNEPKAPQVLACAIEKELAENYLPNPGHYTAMSTATFITNKSYTTLIVPYISDDLLIEMLQKAPSEIITVGSSKSFLNFSRTSTAGTSVGIEPQHEYAVKGYKYENGQHLITLEESSGKITMTLDDFKKTMLTITSPTSIVNFFDQGTLQIYLISSLVTLLALRKAIACKLKKANVIS